MRALKIIAKVPSVLVFLMIGHHQKESGHQDHQLKEMSFPLFHALIFPIFIKNVRK
jgi:hypothetical protein